MEVFQEGAEFTLWRGQVRGHIDSFSCVATEAAAMPRSTGTKKDIHGETDEGDLLDSATIGPPQRVEPDPQKLTVSSIVQINPLFVFRNRFVNQELIWPPNSRGPLARLTPLIRKYQCLSLAPANNPGSPKPLRRVCDGDGCGNIACFNKVPTSCACFQENEE